MAANKRLTQYPSTTTGIIVLLVLAIIFLTYKVAFLSGLNSQLQSKETQQSNIIDSTESAIPMTPTIAITKTPTKTIVDNSKAIAECLNKVNQFETVALANGYAKAEVDAMVAAGKAECKNANELTAAEKAANKINGKLDTVNSTLDSIKNKQDYGF